jgi:hypothetical protein
MCARLAPGLVGAEVVGAELVGGELVDGELDGAGVLDGGLTGDVGAEVEGKEGPLDDVTEAVADAGEPCPETVVVQPASTAPTATTADAHSAVRTTVDVRRNLSRIQRPPEGTKSIKLHLNAARSAGSAGQPVAARQVTVKDCAELTPDVAAMIRLLEPITNWRIPLTCDRGWPSTAVEVNVAESNFVSAIVLPVRPSVGASATISAEAFVAADAVPVTERDQPCVESEIVSR